MGRVIAKKIRGMNLWVKVGLVLVTTLLTTIFIYQEKPVKAASGDVILLWDTANGAVPSGWTSISSTAGDPFYGVFPRAAATYGAATAGSDTHTHTLSAPTATATTTATTGTTGGNVSSTTHTHTWPIPTVTTVDHKPPYKNLVFIKASNPTTVPANAIAIFDTASLPTGWTRYTALDGNYLRGFSDNTTGGAATHNHDTGAVTSGNAAGTATRTNTAGTAIAAQNHNHTIAAQTAAFTADTNSPPYVNVIFAQNTSGAAIGIPNGVIAMFDATPTGNWVVVSNAAPYTNNLLAGSATFGATGGAATFSHGGTDTFTPSIPSARVAAGTGSTAASGTHTHGPVTYTVSSVSSMPVYRDVILAKLNNPAPTITTPLNPASGNQGATLDVVITGTGFLSGAATTFSNSGITVNSTTFNSSTQLTVNITIGPTSATGACDVTVDNPDTQSVTSTNAFTVNTAPGGVILLWDTANGAVPAGWTSISSTAGDPFYGVFPRAAATYGAATAGSDTHGHALTYVSAGSGATGQYATGTTALAAVGHTHTWPSPSVTTVDHKPPFKNLVFIKAINPTQVPANAIAIFDTTTLPSGWTQYTALNGNYLRGFSDNVTGGAATHNHDTGAVTTTALSGTVNTNAGGTNRASATHTHTLTAATNAFTVDNNAPPYVQVVFAYNSSGASQTIPVGMIAMLDAAPTGGWTLVSNAAPYTNNLLQGTATTPGTTGGSATFNHGGSEIYATSGAATGNYASATGTAGGSASAHTHANVTYSIDSQSSYPLYRDVMLAKKTITPPTITTPLNPASGTQGATLNVVIPGTNFQNGATASFSGSGITVNSTTFNSATQLTVNISIDPVATIGARNVTVTNPDGGSVTGTGVFTVNTAPAPTVTSTSPNNAGQGTNNLNVTINGTNFLNGATAAFSGTGITVNSTTYVSATQLTANITITAGAATGLRNVTVTLPAGQTGTGNNVFTVNAGTCTANAPTVTLSADASLVKGQQTSYALSVTNNDNAFCGSTTFTIAIGAETGNTASFVLPSVLGSTTTGALAPGATYNTTLTVKAQAGATIGHMLTSQVNVSGAGHTTQSDSAVTTIVSSWTQNNLLHNSTNATNISKATPYWNANGGWGLPGTKYGAFDCTTCHIPGSTNISRIKVTLTAPSETFPGSAVLFQSKTTVNDGTNPSFGVYSAAISNSTKICEVCHSQTSYHRQNMTAIVGHENQAKEVDCIVCHKHNQGFKAIGGCTICHKFVQRSDRTAVMSQFSSGNSHHIQGANVTDQQCYQCHWEANSDGTVNVNYHGGSLKTGATVDLAVYQAGVRPTTVSAATFVSYSAKGTRHDMEKLNNVCLGCHSAASAAAVPFGDGKTPQQYAWDSRSIDERYSQTGTTPWIPYTQANVTPKRNQTKAFSAHGNATANQRGWNTSETWPNTSGTVNVLCYDCHNSHGSKVAGVTSSYSSATGSKHGGILKDTTTGVGGFTVTYQPSSDTTTAKAMYNPGAGLCFDCHMNSAATGRPWGYATFGASQRIMGYWDSPFFKTPTVAADYFGPAQRYTYKAGTAGAKVANAGGHFGRSSDLSSPPDAAHQINGLCTPCHDPHGVTPNTAKVSNQAYAVPLLKGTWLSSPYKEDKAAVSELVGGGNNAAPLTQSLPGYNIDQNTLQANRAANASNNVAFGLFGTSANTLQTYTDADFAGLCTQCHTKSALTDTTAASTATWKTKNRIHQTVKGWASTAGGNANNQAHAYTCSKCHTPHNSRLPRLMVTNCINYNHRGQVVSGGTVSATASSTNGSGYVDRVVQSGSGSGRFPSGGARYTGTVPPGPSVKTYAWNPGPWGFGVAQGGTAASAYGSNCHNSGTSGGATYNPANQLWNSKTPW